MTTLGVALAIIGTLGVSGYLPGVNVLIAGKVSLSHVFLVEAPLLFGAGILTSLLPLRTSEKPNKGQNMMLPFFHAVEAAELDFPGLLTELHNEDTISEKVLQRWTSLHQQFQASRAEHE